MCGCLEAKLNVFVDCVSTVIVIGDRAVLSKCPKGVELGNVRAQLLMQSFLFRCMYILFLKEKSILIISTLIINLVMIFYKHSLHH